MLRELISALTAGDTLDKAFRDLTRMLDHGRWMFLQANEVLHSRTEAADVRDRIYSRDRSINDLERSIRRKILRHLTVNPGYDVALCLALMSVAKDAERIGDYCKNVFEVGQFYTRGFHVERYHGPLERMRERTVEMFDLVRAACLSSEEAEARKALDLSREIRRQCDHIIQDLLGAAEEIEVHEAVAYSLLARHYKRVVAHLANIATAVISELEDLDFYQEA